PTPDAAFEALKRETVEAVFVNQLQAGMDAFEFLRRLAAFDRKAPVIMMTAHTGAESVLRALRDGAADCVSSEPAAFTSYPAVALRAIARAETTRGDSERTSAVIRSRKQWMMVMDAITDLIFVIDEDGGIVKVNNAFATSIGSHPRVLIGKRINDVFSPDVPDKAFLRQMREDGEPRTYEKQIGEKVYQISIFPMQDENCALAIHVMKNITEVRRLKDQLYHSDKLASIGLLVSGVAHEINNPLTGTIAYTELLSLKTQDEAVKAELQKILHSAERCKKIVDNLMTFSRQRAPSKSLESANDIIDRAVDLQNYSLRSNRIEIMREYDPQTTVFVDAQQIQQVVLNLLVNAQQAITDARRERGRIWLTTRSDRNARRVVVTIADNGPGIPESIAAKVFDPFFTTKPVGIGSGLGLSIAHGIIAEHGGTIRFENLAEGGAAFTIELPTGPFGPMEVSGAQG
ncbi:MAG TPA: ATP-binding protein, partial [Thermoanaerobaculia bacterium]|nr:ATP-binding protein [Thermoanaerobaculia bacterium]